LSAAILAVSVTSAGAVPDEAPSEVTTNWQNTITTTAAQRLSHRAVGSGYGYPGGSGSAIAYDRGAFTPFRADLLSELDLDYGAFGARSSAAARLERPLISSGSDGASCPPPLDSDLGFAAGGCRALHLEAELREAFVHGSTTAGEDQRVSFRLGRHTLIWGESLYFASNGIAGGQAPIDTSMVEKISGYQGETVFLPVGQASVSWQPGGSAAIEAYYQFEWRRSRIGSLGQYVNGAGAGNAPQAPVFFARGGSRTPDSRGQYGIALKWHLLDQDFGFYALRFDAKTPTLQLHPRAGPAVEPFGAVIGTYNEDFPRGIQLYGFSVAGPLGPASYGAEISARRYMPLVTGPVGYPLTSQHSDYPAGDTLHAQFSWTTMTPPLPGIPDGAKWTGEVAGNSLLRTTAGAALRSLDRTKNAAAVRTVFQPQFLQVLPRLDLTLPIGLGVNLFGLSAVDPQMNRGTGDVSIGLVASYDGVWTAALNLTHYFGTAKDVFPYNFLPTGRPLADADFVSLSIQRSF
jgi:hypothetical protein